MDTPPAEKLSRADYYLARLKTYYGNPRYRRIGITVIGILLLLLIAFLFLFRNFSQTHFVNGKTATVFFTPYSVRGDPGTQHSVDILTDTGSAKISGIEIELSYDPSIITSVQLSQPQNSLFGDNGSVISNVMNAKTGRVSYIIATSPTAQTRPAGVGSVATLTFTLAPDAAGKTTKITLLNGNQGTQVTKFGEANSILRNTVALNVSISNGR